VSRCPFRATSPSASIVPGRPRAAQTSWLAHTYPRLSARIRALHAKGSSIGRVAQTDSSEGRALRVPNWGCFELEIRDSCNSSLRSAGIWPFRKQALAAPPSGVRRQSAASTALPNFVHATRIPRRCKAGSRLACPAVHRAMARDAARLAPTRHRLRAGVFRRLAWRAVTYGVMIR
jgi:hypothetical protein